jgi:hypothetical protein
LTLFTTPVIYLWFGRVAVGLARLRGKREPEQLNLPEVTA